MIFKRTIFERFALTLIGHKSRHSVQIQTPTHIGDLICFKLPDGLVRGHAYSLTKVVLAKLNNGSEYPLVRIRNPWGNEKEWNGPWSDESGEWSYLEEVSFVMLER